MYKKFNLWGSFNIIQMYIQIWYADKLVIEI